VYLHHSIMELKCVKVYQKLQRPMIASRFVVGEMLLHMAFAEATPQFLTPAGMSRVRQAVVIFAGHASNNNVWHCGSKSAANSLRTRNQ
jgi:hypothetical protein